MKSVHRCCAEQVLRGPSVFNIIPWLFVHCAQEPWRPPGPGLGVPSPVTLCDVPALALNFHILCFPAQFSAHRHRVSCVCKWRIPHSCSSVMENTTCHSTERGGLGSFAETEAAKPRGSAVPCLQHPNSGSALLHLRLQFL